MFNRNGKFWGRRLGSPSGVEHWVLYSYEYLDDLSFMPLASEVFKDWADGGKIVSAVGERLKKLGWDGDGDIQVMWLPPFAGAGPHNNFGCYALHVKQLEDGISWIASPYCLPFYRLARPDDSHYLPPGVSTMESANWRTGPLVWNTKFIGGLDSDLEDKDS
jgi:hypothetical protein